jgi:hypothetical protein
MCACGKPLHYSSPRIHAMVEQLIGASGPYVRVTRIEDHRAWLVQRHYIALHGLKGEDLGTDRIPKFEEVEG